MKTQNPTTEIRVHIADDHQILIDGLSNIINNSGTPARVIGHSQNGKQTLEWLEQNEADVLILDINMPEMDGIEVIKTLKKRDKMLPIIILSGFHDIKIIRNVLNMGVLGFVSKISAASHIIEAITNVHRGKMFFSEDINEMIVNTFSGKLIINVSKYPTLKDLTRRELEILKLLAEQMNTPEIAEILHIAPTTVDTHKRNIIKKLGVKNSIGLGMYIVKNKLFM